MKTGLPIVAYVAIALLAVWLLVSLLTPVVKP